MVLAVLGRKNVAVLMRDPSSMEQPSDIQGLIYIPFFKSVTEATVPLVKELATVGIKIDVSRL
jgi:predicted nucleotide-binding protein